eukprot:TRINITY_DN5344_c0_g1_i6.p1 TRINITY_DN5344_c0_g1~~TRINITY_DN5344_c0_g1_i6.p1  ORF type:complete len:339 (-),score=45.63 TRINITY_DN5344_c0_g1_i6:66-1043(-)
MKRAENTNDQKKSHSKRRSYQQGCCANKQEVSLVVMDKLSGMRHCPESILFLVDVSLEMSQVQEDGLNRLAYVKKSICSFAETKLAVCPTHSLCLGVFDEKVDVLMRGFTSNYSIFQQHVNRMQPSQQTSNFDLSSIEQSLAEFKRKEEELGRLFRVVFIYGRSSAAPEIGIGSYKEPLNIDLIYIHDKIGPGNCVQSVYDQLCTYVDKMAQLTMYTQYVYELTSLDMLDEYFMYIMAHGLQRVVQEEIEPPKDISRIPYRMSDLESIPLPEIGGKGRIRGVWENTRSLLPGKGGNNKSSGSFQANNSSDNLQKGDYFSSSQAYH